MVTLGSFALSLKNRWESELWKSGWLATTKVFIMRLIILSYYIYHILPKRETSLLFFLSKFFSFSFV